MTSLRVAWAVRITIFVLVLVFFKSVTPNPGSMGDWLPAALTAWFPSTLLFALMSPPEVGKRVLGRLLMTAISIVLLSGAALIVVVIGSNLS